MKIWSRLLRRHPASNAAVAPQAVKADPTVGVRTAFLSGFIQRPHADQIKLSTELYKNVVTFRCIDQIGNCVGSVPWKVTHQEDVAKDGSASASASTADTAFDKAVIRLLNFPNPKWSRAQLFYFIGGSLGIFGNAYLICVRGLGGRVVELWPIPAHRMAIVPSATGVGIQKYRYEFNGKYQEFLVDEDGNSDIIHFWRPNFDDKSFFGAAALRVSMDAAELFNAYMMKAHDFLSNAANISGILNTAAELDQTQQDAVKSALAEFRTGGSRSGDIALLSGVEFKFMSLSEKSDDILSIEGKNAAARDIAMPMGIPPMLLGLPGDNTYANYSEARKAFWIDMLMPNYLAQIGTALAREFYPDGSANIEPDQDKIPALLEARQDQLLSVAKADHLTINEQRAICGFAPLEGEQGNIVPAIEKLKALMYRGIGQSGTFPTPPAEFGGDGDPAEGEPDPKDPPPQPGVTPPGKKPAGKTQLPPPAKTATKALEEIYADSILWSLVDDASQRRPGNGA
jgi:HK97 family phage portal protein